MSKPFPLDWRLQYDWIWLNKTFIQVKLFFICWIVCPIHFWYHLCWCPPLKWWWGWRIFWWLVPWGSSLSIDSGGDFCEAAAALVNLRRLAGLGIIGPLIPNLDLGHCFMISFLDLSKSSFLQCFGLEVANLLSQWEQLNGFLSEFLMICYIKRARKLVH